MASLQRVLTVWAVSGITVPGTKPTFIDTTATAPERPLSDLVQA